MSGSSKGRKYSYDLDCVAGEILSHTSYSIISALLSTMQADVSSVLLCAEHAEKCIHAHVHMSMSAACTACKPESPRAGKLQRLSMHAAPAVMCMLAFTAAVFTDGNSMHHLHAHSTPLLPFLHSSITHTSTYRESASSVHSDASHPSAQSVKAI